jgi:hypothetical protein
MRADFDEDQSPETRPADLPTPSEPVGIAHSIDLVLSSGTGCAALLLPVVAVVGAVLCFAAGLLSTAAGCQPDGSALCSASGPWFTFVLPLFVSPIVAASAAVGAIAVHRHRSTWLAVGYLVVFTSVLIGLASASTGSG